MSSLKNSIVVDRLMTDVVGGRLVFAEVRDKLWFLFPIIVGNIIIEMQRCYINIREDK